MKYDFILQGIWIQVYDQKDFKSAYKTAKKILKEMKKNRMKIKFEEEL